MRLTSALVAATSLFLSTSAFLITPEIAEAAAEAQESWKGLIFDRPRSLDVACHDCAFFIEEKTVSGLNTAARLAVQGVENTIHLDFTSDHGELQVNNATLYPLEAVNEHFPDISAHQTRVDTMDTGIDVPVDFTFGVETAVKPKPRFHRGKFGRINPEDNAELVSVDFTVLSLAGEPVQAQTAHLELLRDGDGSLTIIRLEGAEFDPLKKDPCTTASNPSMCRVRTMIADRLRHMIEEAQARAAGMKVWMKDHAPAPGNKGPKKPCPGRGKFGKAGRPHPNGDEEGKGLSGRPHRGHHGQHHGHRHGHRISRVIDHIIHMFVVPVMLGIAGGLAASALGMMVGQSIAYLWFKFGRGGRRGEIGNIRVYKVEVVDGEKEGLMAEEDLPKYEEAPKYADVEAQT